MKWRYAILGGTAAAAAATTVHDLVQTKHAILRNFPVIGHLRFFLERFGPELRQYIVTSNDEERPFSRDQRRWVYASSKLENNYFGFGTDNDVEGLDGLPDHQAPHLHRAGRGHDAARAGGDRRCPSRQGDGRPARSYARLPARLGRQHLRHELRLAVGQGHRGAQQGRGHGRLLPEHRRGRPVAPPPQRRRPRLPDRHLLLRLPRRARPLRHGTAGRRGAVGTGARDRGQAQPGRQARARRHAPRRQGEPGDRRDPRHRGGQGLRVTEPSHRLPRHRLHARLRRVRGPGDRPAGRDQVGGRQPDDVGRAGRGDGVRDARRRLRQHRRGRGRHGRGADDLRGLRRLPVPHRLQRGVAPVRDRRPQRRRRVHRGGQARRPGERRRRLRARRRHGQRRPRGDDVDRLHPGPEVPHRPLPGRHRDAEPALHARPRRRASRACGRPTTSGRCDATC